MRQKQLFVLAVLMLCASPCIQLFAAENPSGLIADYRFSPKSPLANSISGGLPNLLFDGFHAKFAPLLTGQEIPVGGEGAAGNGWALAWTHQVPQVGYDKWISSNCRIPQDPQLDLGERFTLWMRMIYGGLARNGRHHNLITLNESDGKPVLKWGLNGNEEMEIFLKLVDSKGNAGDFVRTSTSHKLLPQISRWYDLAVSFDRGKVTLSATRIGRNGPQTTNHQSFDLGQEVRLARPSGAMHLLSGTNTAIERLLVYRGTALPVDAVAGVSQGVRLPGPAKPRKVDVGRQRQLFLDDAIVERKSGLKRVLHAVKKHPNNPIIKRDSEIDGNGPNFWGSVVFDPEERLFKLWCMCHTFKKPENLNHLYFTSKDGVHWDRPRLGIRGPGNRFSPPGYPGGHAGMWVTVRKDTKETDSQKRFKGFIQRNPLYSMTSPDGLSWTLQEIAAHYTDDTTTVTFNPQRGEFVKIGRFCPDGRSLALRLMMTCVSQTESADGNSAWHLVMLPDEQDLAADPSTQFYHMPAFAYHGQYIGILGVYHSGTTGPDAGTSDHELTVSRDGLNWHRVCRGQNFIERSSPGSWDDGFGVVPGTGPIRRGDELWFYYGCNDGTHHAMGNGAIGLAKLRLDGFISLQAGESTGQLLTSPFVLKGNMLEVNAKVSGSFQVRILDANTGATLAVSKPYQGDSCHHLLTWRGRPNLDHLKEKLVQMEFTLTNADLYAFQFLVQRQGH